MKIFFLIAISISFFGFRLFSDIYSYSFNTIDGEQKSVSLYQGKKILILVLPGAIRNGDTSYLHLVGEAGAMHKQNLVIIAVPSIEDGYTASGAAITKQWYKKHTGGNMVIASPMYTKKTSASQHPLFSWLTDKNKNLHFDEDVKDEGQSFMINARGELVGVFDAHARLSRQLLEKILAQ